jgi:hypothetical protein
MRGRCFSHNRPVRLNRILQVTPQLLKLVLLLLEPQVGFKRKLV